MSSAVTHVIFDSTTAAQWSIDDTRIHIVHPQWIVDCFHAHKRLDERNYPATNNRPQQQPVEDNQSGKSERDASRDTSFESTTVARLHAIELLLNEKLPSSPEAFLNNIDYYQFTREGKMCVVKSLLRWRFLPPKIRLSDTSLKRRPAVKYRYINDKTTYGTDQMIYKKQQLDQQMSAWKFEMTDYLLTHPPTGPTPIHLNNVYTLCHVYIDAFFISSSLSVLPSNERTRLIGTPVAIIANNSTNNEADDKAIIIDCTTAAKQMGIEFGMTVKEAFERCPSTHLLRYDTTVYNAKGQGLFKILSQFSKAIMPISYNEAVLDLSGHVDLLTSNNTNLEIGIQLQQQIYRETSLYCSLGFGDSLFAAKIATKLAGPNGIFSVLSSTCWTLLASSPLSFLPGISPATEQHFVEQLGITKCGEILGTPLVDLCQIVSVAQAKQLLSIMKGCTNDALKGFFPVATEVNLPRNQKVFLNTLESKQIYKKSMKTLSSKRLKRLTITTRNVPDQMHSLQDEEHLDKSISPLVTELYLRMLRNKLSQTSETKLIIILQLKQSARLQDENQDEFSIDHCHITAATELFNVNASSNPRPDYHVLKSAMQRCIKDLWGQLQQGSFTKATNSSFYRELIEKKSTHNSKTLSVQQTASNILYAVSSAMSYLVDTNALDSSEHSSQTLSDNDSLGDDFKESCELEEPLATHLDGYQSSAPRLNRSVQPLIHYTKAYSMPSRAYEHTCLFSTNVETRIRAYQDAITLILSRNLPGESTATRRRLLQAALHSFVVQLCSDGDLEGIIYFHKKYQFTKETHEYVNTRFSARIM